jgi:hypothetical protein
MLSLSRSTKILHLSKIFVPFSDSSGNVEHGGDRSQVWLLLTLARTFRPVQLKNLAAEEKIEKLEPRYF